MKLNIAKCSFNMDARKFLGFIVSERDIETNIKKINAIKNMQPLKSINDTKRLVGMVAALNRFVSRSMDICLSFFRIIGKVPPWNEECDRAFKELKQTLSSPSLLNNLSKEKRCICI